MLQNGILHFVFWISQLSFEMGSVLFMGLRNIEYLKNIVRLQIEKIKNSIIFIEKT